MAHGMLARHATFIQEQPLFSLRPLIRSKQALHRPLQALHPPKFMIPGWDGGEKGLGCPFIECQCSDVPR